jgi:hypothetical protein
MDGPHIDLLETADMNLTDEQCNLLWDAINPRDLLLLCPSVEEFVTGESDCIPGMSDEFYEYEVTGNGKPAQELLRDELREVIIDILNSNGV